MTVARFHLATKTFLPVWAHSYIWTEIVCKNTKRRSRRGFQRYLVSFGTKCHSVLRDEEKLSSLCFAPINIRCLLYKVSICIPWDFSEYVLSNTLKSHVWIPSWKWIAQVRITLPFATFPLQTDRAPSAVDQSAQLYLSKICDAKSTGIGTVDLDDSCCRKCD